MDTLARKCHCILFKADRRRSGGDPPGSPALRRLGPAALSRRASAGQREAERGATARAIGLDPHLAAVRLDDALHEGEADAGALVLRIEAVEEAEHLLAETRLDAAAVVAHEEDW